MNQNSQAADVETILHELQLYFIKEKTFDELMLNSKLRIDFYIPRYKLCIEFHGAQHYYHVEYFHKTQQDFENQLQRDQLKRHYCSTHNLHLLELPCSLTCAELRQSIVDILNQQREHLGIQESSFSIPEPLPHIDDFLQLNTSKYVNLNQLYQEYQSMLKNLYVEDTTEYQMFKDYVIDKWELNDCLIIKEKGKYVEQWTANHLSEEEYLSDINESQSLDLFVLHLKKEGVLDYSHLPTRYLYAYYKNWLSSADPSVELITQATFTKRLPSKLSNHGFTEVVRKRPRTYKEELKNLEDKLQIVVDDKMEKMLCNVFINSNNIITNQKINEIQLILNQATCDQSSQEQAINDKENSQDKTSQEAKTNEQRAEQLLTKLKPYTIREIHESFTRDQNLLLRMQTELSSISSYDLIEDDLRYFVECIVEA